MAVKSPKNFNYRTGRRRLTPDELERVWPIWRKGWLRYSYLNSTEINQMLEEGISPFSWPGTAIILGKSRAIRNKLLRLRDDRVYRENMEYLFYVTITKHNMLKIAIALAEEEADDWAGKYGMDKDNVFKYEYYLTDRERMSTRRKYRERRWEEDAETRLKSRLRRKRN